MPGTEKTLPLAAPLVHTPAMLRSTDTPSLAVFCDYENVAIGAKDSGYGDFDIDLVLERVLDKGSVVVKKAYCDWQRYGSAKRPLHEAGFELIEIPHVTMTGKNSADIRLVVDAMDLCYTKRHIGQFVIISGDSDFSPLVGKLRENEKLVIGVGVKGSSSNLLVESCDEFIYYDDLVRVRSGGRQKQKKPPEGKTRRDAPDAKQQEALELVVQTADALFRERDDQVWGSLVKQTIKRKRPHFSEGFHGYRNFNALLEDAQEKGLLELQKDERSGGYVILSLGDES
jgi:uncharacterized protein (TIGR00288 family)